MRPAVRIGAWKADPNLDELSCDGRMVKLEPRAMRLLLYLAANRNRVVALSEMLDEIWPNVVVTSQSVYSTIAQLRQILGDSAESPIYIATVPRRGYRLIAEVAEVAECPAVAAPPAADTRVGDAVAGGTAAQRFRRARPAGSCKVLGHGGRPRCVGQPCGITCLCVCISEHCRNPPPQAPLQYQLRWRCCHFWT